MAERLEALIEVISDVLVKTITGISTLISGSDDGIRRTRRRLISAGLVGVVGYGLVTHPPVRSIVRGEVGVRLNQITGGSVTVGEGSILVLPGVHQLRRLSLRDQLYRPTASSKAYGAAPFQSMEGLSIGVDLTIRYALDPAKISRVASSLPEDIGGKIVEPAVQGVIYKTLTRYSVREIFSTKRAEIQQTIEAELKPSLAADGIRLRSVQMGNVDLPADFRAGMEQLLAAELETEKMRSTLELREKQVKERALQSEAEKVQRETAAEAAGNEQIIAAKAQAEAMKHILPFKQKQIEQRQLEAEAEKIARVKGAEANAQARVIEATGEADSRHKLADAEVYRLEQVGKVSSQQMERDGELITRHPLLIQKTLADKLSDKISVIIAPPPADGGFIGAALVGGQNRAANAVAAVPATDAVSEENE